MAKRKNPDDSDQPELPLNGGADASAAEAKPPAAPPKGGGDAATEPALATEPPRDPQDAPLARHYKQWFLEYASYVILDRAVPHINDGLKPVQRRILHTLWEMDDGRFHKVANVTGQTMALHPHGNASIDAALVGIGQLIIDHVKGAVYLA